MKLYFETEEDARKEKRLDEVFPQIERDKLSQEAKALLVRKGLEIMRKETHATEFFKEEWGKGALAELEAAGLAYIEKMSPQWMRWHPRESPYGSKLLNQKGEVLAVVLAKQEGGKDSQLDADKYHALDEVLRELYGAESAMTTYALRDDKFEGKPFSPFTKKEKRELARAFNDLKKLRVRVKEIRDRYDTKSG